MEQPVGRAHIDAHHTNTNLYKFGENVSPHIFHKKNCCDRNIGPSLCISTFFLFPDSGLNLLNGFYFLLEWRDTENQQFHCRSTPVHALSLTKIKPYVYSFHRCSRLLCTIIFPPFSPLCHKYVMPYNTRNYTLLLIQTYDT